MHGQHRSLAFQARPLLQHLSCGTPHWLAAVLQGDFGRPNSWCLFIFVTGRQLICRFHCVLTITGGQSVLKIVETNDFKQLAHISLLFRAGNDSAIKEVLHHATSHLCVVLDHVLSLGQGWPSQAALCHLILQHAPLRRDAPQI